MREASSQTGVSAEYGIFGYSEVELLSRSIDAARRALYEDLMVRAAGIEREFNVPEAIQGIEDVSVPLSELSLFDSAAEEALPALAIALRRKNDRLR
eukprot:4967826-Pyramimonas_sp.AAC.1